MPTHTSKRGETRVGIALQYGLDYRELAAWNGITNPNVISVDQVLVLAAPAGAVPAAPAGVVATPLAGSGTVIESRPLANTEKLKVEPRAWRRQTLARSPRQAWRVKMYEGGLLDLGRGQAKSRINDRLQRFAAAYRQASERLRARADVIDLRYPNGFAMRLARAGEGKR